LAKAESTTKNLSAALARLSIEAREIIERASILAGQLEKISLSLIMLREEGIIKALENECTICRLVTPRIKDHAS
jgi:hypothetical protein